MASFFPWHFKFARVTMLCIPLRYVPCHRNVIFSKREGHIVGKVFSVREVMKLTHTSFELQFQPMRECGLTMLEVAEVKARIVLVLCVVTSKC